MAVAVALEVGLVVAHVVADQVGQREAVVADHVVHRFGRLAAPRLEQVGRSRQPLRELTSRAVASQPEGARGVAEAVVPLQPAAREVAELVAAHADVPGLGDPLHAREHRVLQHGLEERGIALEAMVAASEHRRQVEAKAIDMHLLDPEAQAVHHHLQHARLADVQRVAAAGEVVAAPVGIQAVAAGLVEAAPGDRRPALVALGAVVVDHVQQHLDAGGVQPAHHLAELGARVGRGGVARLGAEEADRVVAPVVDQAVGGQVGLVHVLMHRQQLHRGDAQALQVGDGRVAAQPGVGAAHFGRHAGHALGEALHVQLVEQALGQRRQQATVASPVEGVGDHAGLQRPARVVAHVHVLRVFAVGGEVRVAPVETADDLPRPGIQQHLVRVEAVAAVRPPGAICAKAVDQPGPGTGQVAVPDVVGLHRQRHAQCFDGAAVVEHAQLDRRRVGREDREVDALAVERGAHRPRLAGLQRAHLAVHQGLRSKNTVASGGTVIEIECARPCAGMASLLAAPNGVPTLLPP